MMAATVELMGVKIFFRTSGISRNSGPQDHISIVHAWYVEMFPWSDGTPFNWDETEAEGRLDEMFLTGTFNDGEQLLSILYLPVTHVCTNR